MAHTRAHTHTTYDMSHTLRTLHTHQRMECVALLAPFAVPPPPPCRPRRVPSAGRSVTSGPAPGRAFTCKLRLATCALGIGMAEAPVPARSGLCLLISYMHQKQPRIFNTHLDALSSYLPACCPETKGRGGRQANRDPLKDLLQTKVGYYATVARVKHRHQHYLPSSWWHSTVVR